MNLLDYLTIYVAQSARASTKLMKKGEGTALPGVIVEKLNPNIAGKIIQDIPYRVLITGTNGKTSTQTVIKEIIKHSGKKLVSNSSGSNLKRGIISKVIEQYSFIKREKPEFAVFEVEEATMPKIVPQINPTHIIVTNLYRDQLDAYGEIDRTQKFIREAIELASPDCKLILNNDDPRVSTLNTELENPTIRYSLEEEFSSLFKYEGAVKKDTITQQGIFVARDVKIQNDLTTKFNVDSSEYELSLPGVFQIYNALAALAFARDLQIENSHIQQAFIEIKAAFGRGETLEVDDINYHLLLVKNPAGMNITLQTLSQLEAPNIGFILNDNLADGRDVSWIWDSNLEQINEIKPRCIFISGKRANDMILRIKYALGDLTEVTDNHFKSLDGNIKVYINDDIDQFKDLVAQNLKTGESLYVMPTYTSLLTLRKSLIGRHLEDAN